ncbi:MAG: ROK family protein [Candidatus Sericytochromatia bacterium]|nr:ROK family protein [Candidatus Sericytochromatia bacterium]
MDALALGLDVGGTKILASLLDGAGVSRGEWRLSTPASAGADAVLEALAAAALGALSELTQEERRRVVGVGVSAAGQIDVEAGVVAYASPNIAGWTGSPVGPWLADRLALPVVVENDANAAAYGEHRLGVGQGCRSLVAVTVGTGVGGGLVLDGRLWRGGRWRGGEVGHIVVQAEGVRCNCGQTGCLEVYASGTAIARLAAEAVPGFGGTAHDVFAAAGAGDPTMRAVLARSARFMAQGLVSIASLVDPDMFVLGGGVVSQPSYLGWLGDALRDPAVAGERGLSPDALRLAALGERAGALGAACLALEAAGVSLR